MIPIGTICYIIRTEPGNEHVLGRVIFGVRSSAFGNYASSSSPPNIAERTVIRPCNLRSRQRDNGALANARNKCAEWPEYTPYGELAYSPYRGMGIARARTAAAGRRQNPRHPSKT